MTARTLVFEKCARYTTLVDQYRCWALGLTNPARQINSTFLRCLYQNCSEKFDYEKPSCAKACLAIGNPNLDLSCIPSCSSLHPIDQDQCLNSCRSSHRLSPLYDFKNAFELCEDFYSFSLYTDVSNKDFQQTAEFGSAMRIVCAESFNPMPVCQGIARNTIQKTISLIQTTDKDDSTSFCKAMGFVD
ncbi:hypothetical protein TVAG_267640 [Trichomonas vaginalis G3]|uniref:Uncharacterized protein n=1 Tax=Trichomonas vaginalis (strain ATCC PRA-98 / G3) TaxID=412133 RepID=A2DLB4_TRIV3|nr:hypothetical protein TVAGG3_0714640 [Trichomonas vaginalis G3]EAY18732.1 hypothetical protein TVAG_267640 [Trichomonas vaginalis G3]KAI5510160.1 hypothetical protein TVAGG3_0714640 [Trichomonas vaginalis G3]|eukprot:XP_001579718.1 hypothetical protein [Trichomonas vaginalis G3]